LNTIPEILSHFEGRSLSRFDEVAFLNRLDTKFIFTLRKLPQIFNSLDGNYFVLDIKGIRVFNYSTVYYDTPDLTMFLNHIRGKRNRYKVRQRNYETTHDSFLEVKFKRNNGFTFKWRIPGKKPGSEFPELDRQFLIKHIPYSPNDLIPVLKTSFNRITLTDKHFSQRVTIDRDIHFSSLQNGGSTKSYADLGVIEIKSERTKATNGLQTKLREIGIRPGGFSKYCIGTALTTEKHPKPGVLKVQLLRINKILNYSEKLT